MSAVAVVTCLTMPEPDVDEDLLLDALTVAGLRPALVAWDDPDVDWSEFELAVIRSTWNYIDDLPAFLAWAGSTAHRTNLCNPVGTIRWNTHKGYLRELAADGVPVVPTAWVGQGSGTSLAEVMAQHDWDDVVAKPVVGAGSFLTERIADPAAAEAVAFWQRLVGSRDAMVQPYLASVEDYGERSVIWIDGELTHAVRKEPRLGDAEESVSPALPIATDERELALRIVADLPDDLLFARIDLIRDATGAPLLAELELVEPSLFLLQCEAALERLVAGIRRRVTVPR